jgi:leader peptidase (prepilin peptidase)/N-methyltransferase
MPELTPAALITFTVAAYFVGTAVGSFLNVCIWRLATDRSIIWPDSHCPECLSPIRWHDNLPVFGWFVLGGKCRDCRKPIAFTYALGEICVGLIFAGTFYAYWGLGARNGLHPLALPPDLFGRPVAGPLAWPYDNAVLIAHLYLFGSLWTASMIDMRYKVIPAPITDVGIFVGLAASVLIPQLHSADLFGRAHGAALVCAGWGAGLGWVVAAGLGRVGLWRALSPFAEPDEPPVRQPIDVEPDEGEPPTAAQVRRQGAVDLLQLALPLAGAWAGAALLSQLGFIAGAMNWSAFYGPGAALFGLTAGAATVWLVGIAFSCLLGREAMGMGDVHLMAMVGAFLGWEHAVAAFFLAPFPGLLLVVLVKAGPVGRLLPGVGEDRQIPFGPALATASYGMMLCARPAAAYAEGHILPMWRTLFGT